MPNTSYDFASSAGQTIVFDAATDVLSFGGGFSAASMTLTQGPGSGASATVAVTIGGVTVILQGVTLDKLRTAALTFADGSIAQIGDGLATTSSDAAKNIVTGGAGNDYFDGLGGDDAITAGAGNDKILTGTGTDTIDAGLGDDTIVMGAELTAADRIDGGAGVDELRLAGTYNGLTMVDGTIKNIERLVLEGDGNVGASRNYKLVTHDNSVVNGATLTVDAASLDALDKLDFDGSAESSASFVITGGAAADVIKGGAGNDTIDAGAGNDTITGGQGADVLTGGSGEDLFVVARGASKSDSSPTSIDRITDFEGAGAIGGDRIQLPIPNGGKPLAFAGYKAFSLGGGTQAPNVGDGFADVFYDHFNGQTRIVIDVNDDGLISEVDQVIYLDGIFELQAEDFDAAFTIVRGTEAADDILGSAYGETINALGGDDVVDGRGGNDTILGGAGADELHGGAGTDTIDGGDQDDEVHGDDDNDTIGGGEGNDTLYGDQGIDTINGNNGVDTIDGGLGNDTIKGDAGADVLHGGLNDDTVNGGNDNDQVFGDAGADTLYGDAGDDQIDGGDDNDKLTGGQGTDTLHGGQGNDIVNGDETNAGDGAIDYLFGDAGDDTLYAGTGRDVLTGGAGADKFVVTNTTSSAAYPNRITDFSLAEGDKLQLQISGAKPLTWYGNKPFFFDGNFGNGGVQFPLAGDGLADAIWDYDAATNTTRIAVDVDDDGVFSTGDLLVYLDGQLTLSASDFVDTFAVVRGGAGADVMPGTAGVDTFYGMGGNDTINGEGGNDTLYGGDDDDTIDGGTGQDTVHGDAGNDTLGGGAGVFGDTIYGDAGNDLINGGEGGDNLYGGTENDTVNGELGDDYVYGNEGNDIVNGGDGNDNVYGGDGDDQADGGIGNDTVNGDAGNDTLAGGIGNDTIYGGAGTDAITGGDGDDKIAGDAAVDTIDAGAGADTIYVGAGDIVTGGADADKLNFYYNSNTSVFASQARITDFAVGDKIDVTGISGTGITFVFNGGDRQLGTLSTTVGSQTILGNGNDGLADVLYTTSADGLTTWLIVDVNDDGKLDAADMVVAFDGDIDFASGDFTTGMFKVFRGTEGADIIAGSDAIDTVYGVGGNDEIDGMGGNDTLYGQAGDDNIDGGQGQDTIDGGDDNDTLYGGDGNFLDYVYGGNGNDSIDGGEGNDILAGQAGNDVTVGGLGDDTVDGNAGDDQLAGGDGNDTLRGGTENDQLDGGLGNDNLDGGEGTDVLHGGDNNDTLEGNGGVDTLFGDAGDDLIYAGTGADALDGGTGNDTIWLGTGDVATGGDGADKFRTYYNSNMSNLAGQARVTDFQQGADALELLGISGTAVKFVFNSGDRAFGALSTTAGSQTILGNAGDGLADIYYSTAADGLTTQLIVDINDDGKLDSGDVVIKFDGNIDFTMADFVAGTFLVQRGTDGADVMTGSTAADTIYGVGGNDQIDGGEGNDTLYGQAGEDTIQGGTGQDTIEGGDDNDTLLGGAGSFIDYLYGGNGNDSLDGGEGGDQLYGQAGNDTVTGGLGDDTVDGAAGDDVLDGGEGADTMRGGTENDVVHGGLGNDNIDGGDGVDVLHGDDNDDTINGGAGDDDIFGGDGNDTIYTGTGIDEVDGGAGDDTILFGKGDVIAGGAGADKFRTYYNSDTSVLAGIARITDFQQGVDKLELTGIAGNARLFAVNPGALPGALQINDAMPFGGDAFADIVYSHETGPNGPVTRVYIDENDNGKLDATDVVFEIAGHLNLTAADFTSATFNAVRGTPGADTMTGTGAGENIYGAAGNDTVNGGAGNDYLYGQDGDDVLNGEADSDSLYGGAGNDALNGGIGGDYLYGEAGSDTLEGNEGNDNLNGGLDGDVLRGGFGTDTLNGNEGADSLEGGADSDTLNGGDGADSLLGQDGADTLKGDAGDDMIEGGALADVMTGGAGNDTIDGGTEIDTAVFSGNLVYYEIIAQNGGITVRDLRTTNSDGTDFLTNVEKLQFNDGTIQGSFLTVSDGVVVEGDSGQKMMAFTVSLIGSPANVVTVNFATTNGTAQAGTDYAATNGSLSFAVGETSKTVYVPINGDATNEIDEAFSLTLNTASGAAIVDGVGQGTILNDDCTVSIGDAQVTEGNSGTKQLSFTISLDKPAAGPISVSYKTLGNTATEGSDYVANAGFVQFAAGEQTKTVSITISGDQAFEGDESFWVQLLSATGAKIGDGQGQGTIQNDDVNHAPVIGAESFTITSGEALETTAAALLANDSDADGQPLSLLSVQGAVNGTVSLVDGDVVFTPAANYVGAASFTYTVSDGAGGTTTGTVNVTVEAPPVVDDLFVSTAANETFNGGVGNDTVSYAGVATAVTVSLANGAAQATGGGGTDTLTGIENLIGSAYGDQLTGNAADNLIDGGAGGDTMRGGTGNDSYLVDNKNDKAIELAGEGTDTLFASVDHTLSDFIENLVLTGTAIKGVGNALDNLITGNASDNLLYGGAGADVMAGGLGNDIYYVENAGDTATEEAGAGNDMVSSSVSFTLGANIERLVLTGAAAINGTGNGLANTITGNGAANILDGGAGADYMKGGAGNDTYYVDHAGDVTEEAGGGGTDTVYASIDYSVADQAVENLILTGTAIKATGNALANTITGNASANILIGGAGNDAMIGGLGNDIYYVDSLGDVVTEAGGEGTDQVRSTISYTLGANLENLTLAGTVAINGTGNGFANTILGNAESNVIDGGIGADTMKGGAGNDSYVVDNVADKIFELDAEGTDTVLASVTFGLGAYIEHLTLTGSAAINATGNTLDNRLTGNSGVNTLNGGAGNDSLQGGLGSDTLTGGAGLDSYWFETALGATNVDKITDFSAVDDTLVLDRSVFTGIGADGGLAAGAFQLGSVAVDADDRILYDAATGNIYYDADGAGGSAAVLFAQVTANTALTHADFLAVA